jgi:hypothetical protein
MSTLSPPIIDRFTAECALVWRYGDPYKVFDLRRGVPRYTFVCNGGFFGCFQTYIFCQLYLPGYFFPTPQQMMIGNCPPITERGEGSRSSSSPFPPRAVDSNSDLPREKIPFTALTHSATEEATNTMLIYAVL